MDDCSVDVQSAAAASLRPSRESSTRLDLGNFERAGRRAESSTQRTREAQAGKGADYSELKEMNQLLVLLLVDSLTVDSLISWPC